MNRWYIKCAVLALGFALIIAGSSCRNDFEYAPSTGNLLFSKDTVFLDTIFTNIGSSTYTLKVYNRTNQDILIPSVGLERGQDSNYRLNVDGLAGKEFEDIPLLSKDSLFVFIETTVDISALPENEFLYTESLIFGEGGNAQEVQLVTLVKDAVFLFPDELGNGTTESLLVGVDNEGNDIYVEGFLLEETELQFTNEKPYVIYGYAAVPEGEILTIAAGARVHFHQNSGIMVNNGASIQVNGLLSEDQDVLENEVIFEGDRLEPAYAAVPGQWGTIWLREGSIDNTMDYLTIKNATTGVRVDGNGILDNPTLTIRNAQIYNSLNSNLLSVTAHIQAANCVLGNAGMHSFHGNLGGKYSFTHCTLANYWPYGFRTGFSLQLDNFILSVDGETVSEDLQYADFTNCIIYGSQNLELGFLEDSSKNFNISFTNCLLRFNDTSNQFMDNPLYNFDDTSRYRNSILNQDPDFMQPIDNQFLLGEMSAALHAAEPNIVPPLPLDILGIDRTTSPDIGAYEAKIYN